MMRSALNFLTAEVRGLQKAVYVLAICALLSAILALLRDRLLAATFGAATTLDLYYAAFRIPDFIFVCTGALVSVYMLIPELARRDEAHQNDYFDTILAGFFWLAIIVCGVAALLAPYILMHLFPQFVREGHLPMLTSLTRIILLQPILLGFSNIFAAITQSRHRYTLYAISPLLYNLGIIVGVLLLYPLWGISGLAWGVVFGAVAHMGIQVPSLISDGFLRRFPKIIDTPALWNTVFISIPRALALSMNQLTFIGLVAIAGSLTEGSIAVFMFAYNLQAVPLSIIGASYSVAAFPTLATALSAGRRDEFIEHVSDAARYVFFWSLPATALIVVLRAHLVRVVLGSGRFDWTDTRLTAASFALLALSLAAQGLMLLLVRGYYAAGRTFIPFLINVGITIATVVLGALFVGVLQSEALLQFAQILLRVEDVPGTSVLALALAYALVSILGTVVLMLHFEYRFCGFLARVSRAWGESLVAALAAGLGAYIVLIFAGPLTFASTTASVLSRGALAGLFGLLMAGISYYLSGSREFNETLLSTRDRFFGQVPAPQEIAVTTSAEEIGPATPQ